LLRNFSTYHIDICILSVLIGIGKSPPSHEAQDKKSIVENDLGIHEKFESLKLKLDKMKAISSTLKEDKELMEKLRVMEDLLRNFNGKKLQNIENSIEDSNQSEKKSSELQGQTSKEELVDQNLKTTGKNILSFIRVENIERVENKISFFYQGML